jgi:hypothetical protein
MNGWLSGGMPTAAIALPALSGAAWADDFRCSNETLQGEYAFAGLNNLRNVSRSAGPPESPRALSCSPSLGVRP